MKKLKYRDYKWYAQGLTAIKWQSQAVGSMWSHLKSNSWRAVSSNGPQQNCKVGGLLSLPPPLFWSPFYQSLVIFHFCMFSNFLFMSNNLTQLSVFPKHHSTKKEREKEKEKKKNQEVFTNKAVFYLKTTSTMTPSWARDREREQEGGGGGVCVHGSLRGHAQVEVSR